ncbi:MAG: hypothetical protein RL260_3787 [Pseudomonadota bacterium]|jgi:hypothetical protein
MTNDQDTQAQDFLNKMPPSLPQSRTLLDEYIATVPDGTPPQVLSLLRRTFIAGAVSHLEVVRAAFALPSLEEGDPTELLDAVAALGVGAQVLMDEEDHIIRSGQNKPDDTPRIVTLTEGYAGKLESLQ